MAKDKYYHLKKCEIVKKAVKSTPFIYIHTSKEVAQHKGYMPCPQCNSNDLQHSADFLRNIRGQKKEV